MAFKKPQNLLTMDSLKTMKSQKRGYDTYIMYLTPHKDNDSKANACPSASKGCIAACLFNSGNARFNRVQAGRKNKSNYFIENRNEFMIQLDQEIGKLSKRYLKKSNKLCIRLNGTSDWAWEEIIVRDNKSIFELYPNIIFYDYTKTASRFNGDMPNNYHLTFSRSESNSVEVLEVLKGGGNVAVVFSGLPETYLGYEVVNGDIDDLIFLQPKNVVVGLSHKRAATKGGGKRNDLAISSGFVVETDKLEIVAA